VTILPIKNYCRFAVQTTSSFAYFELHLEVNGTADKRKGGSEWSKKCNEAFTVPLQT
jgi:hypothetical protein